MRSQLTTAVVVSAAGTGGYAGPAYQSMQIHQVIGGVNGDTSAQAIQLRMRVVGQGQVQNARLVVRDAIGANPITIVDFANSVPNAALGDRVLVTSPNFANYTDPTVVPDFVMINLIPASYLAAGSLTYEQDIPPTVHWRLSWEGASYTGLGSGSTTNDVDGNFNPPFAGPCPSASLQALRFIGGPGAASTNNAANYTVTAGAATFVNNAGTSFDVSPPVCADTLPFATTRLYVKWDAAGTNSGTSWSNAFTTLQDALCSAAANPGVTEVWSRGTYRPDESAGVPSGSGDRGATFRMLNGVALYGFFAGTETLLSERDFTVGTNVTILSGDLSENDVYSPDFPNGPSYAENSLHVVTASGTDETAVLDTFTIMSGNANLAAPNDAGGGLFVSSAQPGRPTVRGCWFEENYATFAGGGARITCNGAMRLQAIFSYNATGQWGGGLNLDGGSPRILSYFIYNESGNQGGGALIQSSDAYLVNSWFYRNQANYGGGLSSHESTITQMGCEFAGNQALSGTGGGAIFHSALDPGDQATIVNCTFAGNTTTGVGAVIQSVFSERAAGGSDLVTFRNSILWGNSDSTGSGPGSQIHTDAPGTATVQYCIVQGGWNGTGDHNQNTDPRFLNPATDDYRLMRNSPALDAGDNNLVAADVADVNGNGNTSEPTPLGFGGSLRFWNFWSVPDTGVPDASHPDRIVDLGAYEHPGGEVLVSPNYLQTPWVDDGPSLQDALAWARRPENVDLVSEIWVAAGTHKPDYWPGFINPGDRSASFELIDGVAIYGGFEGDETSVNQRNVDSNATILSGDLNGNDQYYDPTIPTPRSSYSENSHHVVTCTAPIVAPILDGFTIRGGEADVSAAAPSGAGVYAIDGPLTIRNCRFLEHFSAQSGTAVTHDASTVATLLVEDCSFDRNRAGSNGGPAIASHSQSALDVRRCTFFRNVAGGGAVAANSNAAARFVDCRFEQNRGNALAMRRGSRTIIGCDFIANRTVDAEGGAALMLSPTLGAEVEVVGCRFLGNVSPASGTNQDVGGGAIYSRSEGSEGNNLTVANCLFVGNTAARGGAVMLANHDLGGGSAAFINCAFVDNRATWSTGDGGGIWAGSTILPSGPSSFAAQNCIFWNNRDAGGMDSSAQIHVAGGKPTVNYSTVQGGWIGGTGIGVGDPIFTRPPSDGGDGWGDNLATAGIDESLNDDFGDPRLSSGSPASDAGNNAALPLDTADVDGDANMAEVLPLDLGGRPRRVDDPCAANSGAGTLPLVDMGPYERSVVPGAQPVLYVNADATGADNGTNWTDAFTDLQDALCAASTSGGVVEEIRVAAGTYKPTRGTDRTASFELVNGVALIGGFTGDETRAEVGDPAKAGKLRWEVGSPEWELKSETRNSKLETPNSSPSRCGLGAGKKVALLQRERGAGETILSGDLLGNDQPNFVNYGDNSFHVVTASGVDAATLLENLTITGGNADGAAPDHGGGGMRCDSAGPTVLNCTLTGNRALEGGALYLASGSTPLLAACTFDQNLAAEGHGGAVRLINNGTDALFRDCTFSDNVVQTAATGGGGGAIYNQGNSSLTVNGGRFLRNRAEGGSLDGGAMATSGADAFVVGAEFLGNVSEGAGGAVKNKGACDVTIANCLFIGNTADNGGAISNSHFDATGGSARVVNCSLVSNVATQNGGGLSNSDGADPAVANCILWANSNGVGLPAQIHSADPGSTPVVNHSIVQGDWSGAGDVGVIDANPVFAADPDPGLNGWDGLDDNYGDLHLSTNGSPAIDAGNNAALALDAPDLDCDGNIVESVPLDFDGAPRFVNYGGASNDCPHAPGTCGDSPIVDMGAFEVGALAREIIYVDAGNTMGPQNGKTWPTAFRHLQDALTVASNLPCGALQIWVADGIYRPDESIALPSGSGDRLATFQLLDGVALYGGLAGNEDPLTFDLDTRNFSANPTILSGDLDFNDSGPPDPMNITRQDNSFHVVTGTGATQIAVLDGFMVQDGNAVDPPAGGGLIASAEGPTLRNCTVLLNSGPCAGGAAVRGSALLVDDLTLVGNQSSLPGQTSAISKSHLMLDGAWSIQNESVSLYGAVIEGTGSIQLDAGSELQVRSTPVCDSETLEQAEGTLAPGLSPTLTAPADPGPPVLPVRWHMDDALLRDMVLVGQSKTWVIAPSGISLPATLDWTGNSLLTDMSTNGQVEAVFSGGGLLSINGSVYEVDDTGAMLPQYTGVLLLTAKVTGFRVRETGPNELTFVGKPTLIPTGGALATNPHFVVAGGQRLTMTLSDVEQDGGALIDFGSGSTLEMTTAAHISLKPASPLSGRVHISTDVAGAGDIVIELGQQLVIEGAGTTVDLSGVTTNGCADTDPASWGTITVNGELVVHDATVQNTNVHVNLADIDGSAEIVNNELNLLESSADYGGQFFVDGAAVIQCNVINSFGDRYLDLDPNPYADPRPFVADNRIFVFITQGTQSEQGELLELRAFDHDVTLPCQSPDHCAIQLDGSDGFDDTWTLERLEVLPDAKVNLTNRQGFEFNITTNGVQDTLYVKDLIIGTNGVLNVGLQRMYYQNLEMGPGAVITDIPVLGFSLKVIAMQDDTEFDVRVRTRLRDEADDPQPLVPPFTEGQIERIDTNGIGVMDMRTRAEGQLSAASVAAKGAFARSGEDEVVVAFDYLFMEGPAAELVVYLTDTPDPDSEGCTTNGACDMNCCEIARLQLPPAGRDGAATALGGTGEFASYYGEFPRGELDFHRGTYVELELRGADARLWIDNWDPRIRCSGCADLNGTGGPEGEDYLLLLASFGLDIDANTRAETGQQENADCFDSVLGGDRYVDTGDLLAWDTFLDEDALNACGTGLRGEPRGSGSRLGRLHSPRSSEGNREPRRSRDFQQGTGNSPLVRESFLEPQFGGFPSHAPIVGKHFPTERPEMGISGQQAARSVGDLIVAGKPDGAGLQDDYLYSIDIDGTCPGGSPVPAAAGPGTRGHGRLVTAPDGTLYQLHSTGGVLPLDGGAALVAPATNLTPTSNSSLRVTVGVNDFGGGEFLGLPIADAAFDPTNENELYVLPVLVTPFGGDTCDRYKAAAKLVLSGGTYTVQRLYEVPAANRTPPCDWPPQLDQGEFREIEISTDGSKVFIASARADNDNDWLLVFTESSGALATAALIGEVPPEGIMPAGLTVAAPLAMLASRVGQTPYLYLAAGVNAAPSETVGGQSVARTRLFRFNVSSGVSFAGALDIANPECVNPYDTLGCTSTLTALVEKPADGTLYALGFTSPRFDVDYPYNSPPFGGPNPNQIVIFTTPTLAIVPSGAAWSMTVPPAPPSAAQATATLVTCADVALPISLAWSAACPATGDGDGDLDVDLKDFAGLQGCFTGTGSFTLGAACSQFNADCDADVDLADYARIGPLVGP